MGSWYASGESMRNDRSGKDGSRGEKRIERGVAVQLPSLHPIYFSIPDFGVLTLKELNVLHLVLLSSGTRPNLRLGYRTIF